ncbi:IclR family transcriptional regulator [Gallaecimonas mangrovi]|uniref:IclR family transcriptional regulator n=1 Tax=Gallaecimonas mangrovi TaxID=2291597 RepID=UPI001D029260|nr:IclR family transcriptional regulator [Gallaecimonas mangrovi]
MPDAPQTAKRLVPAIERAALILDFIAENNTNPGVSALARQLKLPKSSVHGICDTLCELGLLRAVGGGFDMGPGALRWSAAFMRRSSLAGEFNQLLAADNRLDDYTLTLSALSGGDVVYLACRNAAKPLGFTFQLGMRLPAIYTATGKAMLSAMGSQEREQFLRQHWAEPLTEHSVKDANAFEAQVARWLKQGFALDNGEVRDGMVCLGAPVLDANGKPVAGIALSMTSAESKPAVLEQVGAVLVQLAGQLQY